MFWRKYPYSDLHDLNLDWIISRILEFSEQFEGFLNEFQDLKDHFEELVQYVTDHLSDENFIKFIRLILEQWLEDGTLQDLVTLSLRPKALFNDISLNRSFRLLLENMSGQSMAFYHQHIFLYAMSQTYQLHMLYDIVDGEIMREKDIDLGHGNGMVIIGEMIYVARLRNMDGEYAGGIDVVDRCTMLKEKTIETPAAIRSVWTERDETKLYALDNEFKIYEIDLETDEVTDTGKKINHVYGVEQAVTYHKGLYYVTFINPNYIAVYADIEEAPAKYILIRQSYGYHRFGELQNVIFDEEENMLLLNDIDPFARQGDGYVIVQVHTTRAAEISLEYRYKGNLYVDASSTAKNPDGRTGNRFKLGIELESLSNEALNNFASLILYGEVGPMFIWQGINISTTQAHVSRMRLLNGKYSFSNTANIDLLELFDADLLTAAAINYKHIVLTRSNMYVTGNLNYAEETDPAESVIEVNQSSLILREFDRANIPVTMSSHNVIKTRNMAKYPAVTLTSGYGNIFNRLDSFIGHAGATAGVVTNTTTELANAIRQSRYMLVQLTGNDTPAGTTICIATTTGSTTKDSIINGSFTWQLPNTQLYIDSDLHITTQNKGSSQIIGIDFIF